MNNTGLASHEVRTILHKQLDAAIATHEKLTNYMINKGYYHTHNVSEQLRIDMQAAQTAFNLQLAPTSIL